MLFDENLIFFPNFIHRVQKEKKKLTVECWMRRKVHPFEIHHLETLFFMAEKLYFFLLVVAVEIFNFSFLHS